MRLAVIVVGLMLAASVAWFAAEQHYENCVEAAKGFDSCLSGHGGRAHRREVRPDPWGAREARRGMLAAAVVT